jgi:predicted RND superfamily exporter protein
MLPEGNRALVISNWLDETFGKNEGIFIGLERPYGSVFDRAFLARIREFSGTAEEIAIVKDVTSILTMSYITADGDSIYITDLVDEDFSGIPDEITELKHRLTSWELYEGQSVSADLSATQIIVQLNITTTDMMKPEVQADIRHIRDIAREVLSGFANVYVTGDAIVRQMMPCVPICVSSFRWSL